ncbi:MAG: hypothetical protein ACXWLW_12270 [Rhizomicrobium sp.]
MPTVLVKPKGVGHAANRYSADLSVVGAIRFRLRSSSYGGQDAIAPYALDHPVIAVSDSA